MHRTGSLEFVDDDFILEEYIGGADFNFDLQGFHSDAKNLLQSFVKREVVKDALAGQYKKLKDVAQSPDKHIERMKEKLDKRRDKLKQAIKNKKKQLEDQISAPPFLRISDKIAFTLALVIICLTEYVILKEPTFVPMWYTSLLIPLLILRYYFYYKAKFQYFMIDFCYFAQYFLLFYIHFVPRNAEVFQVAFALCSGPLAMGALMWRNSLVFHDLDKLTSVFIHVFPPLVVFCIRWYPMDNDFTRVCTNSECTIDVQHAFIYALVYYAMWQGYYLLQTEVIDKKKLEMDAEIMTSARWMSLVKPHPVWVYLRKKGVSEKSAAAALVGTQFLYTILTLVPVIPIYQNFYLHCLYLATIIIMCVWNGANFYFEIFSDSYSKRLSRYLKDVAENTDKKHEKNSNTSSRGQPLTVPQPVDDSKDRASKASDEDEELEQMLKGTN